MVFLFQLRVRIGFDLQQNIDPFVPFPTAVGIFSRFLHRYYFNVATIEEAKALTESDPAIQAGRLEMELRPWYGSAALVLVNDWHKKLSKEDI